MTRIFFILALITLLLAACQMTDITVSSTLEPTKEPALTSAQAAVTSTHVTLLTATTSPPTASASPTPTSTPIAPPPFTIHPLIHEQPGDIYETVFTIPVGGDSIIQYEINPDSIQGPNAIAVLPDDSFLIADLAAYRLLHYDKAGHLLSIIELEELGIKTVADLRVKGSTIFLLEISYENYQVHQLSLDGELIASDKIPHRFPIGEDDLVLENILTGIAIDCDRNIILELAGGSKLYHLADVQTQSDPANVTKGYFCNGKRYMVINPGPGKVPNFIAGDIIYETQLTTRLGGLKLLNVIQDGGIYVVRSDLVDDPVGPVDLTVHYIGSDGVEAGVARVPPSEFYYYIMRSAAIGPHGEVFVLLPRPDSTDIVRLNFYKELEPLIPGAVIPQIIRK